MSYWTYINGTINVSPLGRTQAEKRYILDTVLEHLPIVSGSEEDMHVYVIQKAGYDGSCSCDEFGQVTNNLRDRYGRRSRNRGWLRMQSNYILVVDASLRDREYNQTYYEFQKWLCRLAKRVHVKDVLVEIRGYEKHGIIRNNKDVYGKMFEDPTWSCANKEGEPTWSEFLMWDRAKNSSYPLILAYKYFADKENDLEAERRINYYKKENT